MWRQVMAVLLSLVIPAGASAGPLRDAAEKAARETSLAQQPGAETGGRSRFWTGIALLAGGAVLVTLGAVEIGDDEDGPDDEEDFDESDDGEDADTNKALIASGVAAAVVGSWLTITGRRSGTTVSPSRGSVVVRHTVRF
jgi:hypothetical protein